MRYYVSWKTTGYYRKDSLKFAARCPVSGCWPSCTQHCAAVIAASYTVTSQISFRYFGSSVWHWFAILESVTHLYVLPSAADVV